MLMNRHFLTQKLLSSFSNLFLSIFSHFALGLDFFYQKCSKNSLEIGIRPFKFLLGSNFHNLLVRSLSGENQKRIFHCAKLRQFFPFRMLYLHRKIAISLNFKECQDPAQYQISGSQSNHQLYWYRKKNLIEFAAAIYRPILIYFY